MNSPKDGKDGNVVKGPWPEKKPEVSDIDGPQIIEDLKFADDLTEGIMVQLVSTFEKNGINISGDQFNGDIGFAIEVMKSIIYRSMGYQHPLHGFMGDILNMTITNEGDNVHYETSLNLELLGEVSDFINITVDNDGPDIA